MEIRNILENMEMHFIKLYFKFIDVSLQTIWNIIEAYY